MAGYHRSINSDADLFQRAQSGDIAARNAIVEANLPLVRKFAGQYSRGNPVRFDDLCQVGSLAVMRAIRTFDAALSQFSSYAGLWIRGMMGRHLRCDCIVRDRRLERGVTREEVLVLSLDLPIEDEEGVTHLDLVVDASLLPDEQASEHELSTRLDAAIAQLPGKRMREIMRARWRGLTLREVGQLHGVSGERIRQMEVQALPTIRATLALRRCPQTHFRTVGEASGHGRSVGTSGRQP